MISFRCGVADSVDWSDWLQPNNANTASQILMIICFNVFPHSGAFDYCKNRPERRQSLGPLWVISGRSRLYQLNGRFWVQSGRPAGIFSNRKLNVRFGS
jgi:hypothetical protein